MVSFLRTAARSPRLPPEARTTDSRRDFERRVWGRRELFANNARVSISATILVFFPACFVSGAITKLIGLGRLDLPPWGGCTTPLALAVALTLAWRRWWTEESPSSIRNRWLAHKCRRYAAAATRLQNWGASRANDVRNIDLDQLARMFTDRLSHRDYKGVGASAEVSRTRVAGARTITLKCYELEYWTPTDGVHIDFRAGWKNTGYIAHIETLRLALVAPSAWSLTHVLERSAKLKRNPLTDIFVARVPTPKERETAAAAGIRLHGAESIGAILAGGGMWLDARRDPGSEFGTISYTQKCIFARIATAVENTSAQALASYLRIRH